jgi:hypothetical protein
MRNRARVVVAASAIVCVVIVVGAQQNPQTQVVAPTGPIAAEKYKNIQVLKDVPADQLEIAMRFVSAATGHQCVDCHVQEADGQFSYDKDEKRPKATAREMMKIVKTVNDEFFMGRVTVTCATCHKGARPVGQPGLAEMLTPEQIAAMSQPPRAAGPAPQAPPPAGAPAGAAGPGGPGRGNAPPAVPVDDVLSKYVTALGGRPAIEKLQALVMSGTLTNRAGQNLPFTIEEKANKYRETVQSQPAAMTRGFDGTSGWAQSGTATTDLTGFLLLQALRISDLGLPLTLKDKYQNLRSVRAQQIGGKDMVALSGAPVAGVTETLFFDAGTGLLVRRSIATRTPLGNLAEQVDYSDYRDVLGAKLPFQIKRTSWDTVDTLKVVDVKPNAQIADARFMRPKG